MSQILTKPVVQEQREQKLERRTPVKRIVGFTIVATSVAVVASLVAAAVFAQRKATTSTR